MLCSICNLPSSLNIGDQLTDDARNDLVYYAASSVVFLLILYVTNISGGGSHLEQGGLFNLSGHICMEKNYFSMEGQ